MKAKYRAGDYEARLHGGIVFWDGAPVTVFTDGGGQLNLSDMVTGRDIARNIDPLDDRLDISSFELGYFNTDVGAYYLSRIPHRRYKQALDYRAVAEYFLGDGDLKLVGQGRSNVVGTKDFRDSYDRESKHYPRFDEAVNLLETRKSVALSRSIAISMDRLGLIQVWFKLEQVGYMEQGSRTVKVPGSEKAWVISNYLSELDWIVE